jgi:WD40 repeat protein
MGKMEVATLTDTSSLSLPPDSYIYKILQVDSKIAAISSDDSLRVIDSTSLNEIRDGILNNVHAGVTCLEALRNDRSIFLTAGRDAVVRSWDLRSGKSTLDLSDGKSGNDRITHTHLQTGR